MFKTAVFLEGQTELIFVREMLLKVFQWQNIDLQCRTLFSDGKFNTAEYDFPNPEAKCHFQLINVGNDNAVLSRMLSRESYLWNAGYHKVCCLRDMYSENYRKVSQALDEEVCQKFIEGARNTIQNKALKPKQIFFHFAIMEVEAWMLAVPGIFHRKNPALTTEKIKDSLGVDLLEVDPELSFYHPAKVVDQILNLVGEAYSKKKAEIDSIASQLQQDEILELAKGVKVASFKKFFEDLIPEEIVNISA